MSATVDLDSLVSLEQSFFDAGYADGYAHGRIHGLIEGRALGREQGFALWEELGFYEAFAATWTALAPADERAAHHAGQLRALVAQFPRTNPSPDDASVDIARLLRQIRSRYKGLCAAVGVRPTLRAADESQEETMEEDEKKAKRSVWAVRPAEPEGLSF